MAFEIDLDNKTYYLRRLAGLDLERQSFITHWKELSDYIEPRKGVFLTTNRNKGEKRNQKIINSRGTQALRSATAGLFAGIMSPSRPWFKLAPLDENLLNLSSVRTYTDGVEKILRSIFLEGGLYSAAPIAISESLLFGTGAMSHVDDFQTIARFDAQTVGSYYIGQNHKREVDTFVSVRDMTIQQIVMEYGYDNCSLTVQSHWDRGEFEKWYTICQFIEPNPKYNPNGNQDNENMPWRSVHFELGRYDANTTSQYATSSVFTDNKFLRKSGFEEFPIPTIRWSTTGEDIYGTNCPGMVALGDIKSLQIMEKRKAQAIDKLVNPPLKGPPNLLDIPINSLPGGVTLYDQDATKEGLTALYQINPSINQLREDMNEIERRINEAFFVDLFLSISEMEGIQPRNQLELSQRNAERLLMLGPPLERVQFEFLGKVIERTFKQAERAEILPDLPPELEGQSLKIDFTSSLAYAQRAHEVGAIERLAQFGSGLAQVNPNILDKIDFDEMIDKYSAYIGTPPKVLVNTEEVKKAREQRAQQQQQMMQSEAMANQAKAAQSGAGAVKSLADAQNAG